MAKYSEEIRQQTVAYIIESKRSITQVAKEIRVNVNSLCRWVNDYRKRHNMPTYAVENGIKERMPKDEEELRARIKQLERQLKDKERELEHQKTAAEDE
ncbi:MAG: transposase, partial [Lachnospiraceae bacterium]|nr:transposase [Lachnospiraceae bacterium]